MFDLLTQGHRTESETFAQPSELRRRNDLQDALQTSGRGQDPGSSSARSDLMSDPTLH